MICNLKYPNYEGTTTRVLYSLVEYANYIVGVLATSMD